MKTVARISLVALLLAGFAAPSASAAPTSTPTKHDDSPTVMGRAYNDWCLVFPPAPACKRSKFWS